MLYSTLTTKYLIDIADTYLGITFGVALGLSLFVFTASIIKELSNATEGKFPDYRGVIWFTFGVFLSFLVYKPAFKGCMEITDRISFMMINYKDWANFIDLLNNVLSDLGKYNISSIDVSLFLTSLSLVIVVTTEDIFGLLRFILLAMLYILGPLILVVSIYKPARNFFKKWLLLLFQVMVWIIFLRIVQGIILSLNPQQYIRVDNPGYVFIFASVIVLSYIQIPILTTKIINTNNVNLLAEIISTSTQVLKLKDVNVIKKTGEFVRNITTKSSFKINRKTITRNQTEKENQIDESVRTR